MGFWKNKRVLVTGATGFLGAFLCHALADQQARVFGLARKKDLRLLRAHGISRRVRLYSADITNPVAVRRVFEKTKPQYCFHLAGFASPKRSDEQVLQALSANLDGSLSVIFECARQGVKLVVASSVRVYGLRGVFDETSVVDEFKTYAFSKIKMEQVVRFLVKKKRLKAVIVRFGTIYGPIRFPVSEHFVNENVVYALKGKQAKNDRDYIRDFLFVSDAITGALLAGRAVARLNGETFNLSFGKSFSGVDVARQIQALVKNRRVVFRPVKNQRIKNRHAFEKLGWEPVVFLKEGLQQTIDWHKKNPRVV